MTKTPNNASLLIDFQTRSKQIKHFKRRHQNESARFRISNSVKFFSKRFLEIFFNMPNSFLQQKIKITPMHDLMKFDSILPEGFLGWMPNHISIQVHLIFQPASLSFAGLFGRNHSKRMRNT